MHLQITADKNIFGFIISSIRQIHEVSATYTMLQSLLSIEGRIINISSDSQITNEFINLFLQVSNYWTTKDCPSFIRVQIASCLLSAIFPSIDFKSLSDTSIRFICLVDQLLQDDDVEVRDVAAECAALILGSAVTNN